MHLEPKDVMRIPTMKAFNALLDMLNLTDRQRAIFSYKYGKGWRHIDIAEELKISQDTVGDEVKVINGKLKSVREDYFRNVLDEIPPAW